MTAPDWTRQNFKKNGPASPVNTDSHVSFHGKPVQRFADGGEVYDKEETALLGRGLKYREDEEGRKFTRARGLSEFGRDDNDPNYGNYETRYYSFDDIKNALSGKNKDVGEKKDVGENFVEAPPEKQMTKPDNTVSSTSTDKPKKPRSITDSFMEDVASPLVDKTKKAVKSIFDRRRYS